MQSAPVARLDAQDLRTGGRWTPLQSLKNTLIRLAIGALLAVADRLPAPALLRVLESVGASAGLLARSARRRAERAIARALPEVDARGLARASFARAGRSLGECLLLRRPDVRALDWVEIAAADRALLEAALAQGRGAIVVSAHLGPFELVPAVVAELGLRPAVVVRESYDPSLDRVVDRHRLARGVRVIHRGKAGAPARLLRALRDGCPLGILPDLPGRTARTSVPFLASERELSVGPARLAARTGVPLLVATLGPGRTGAPPYRLDVAAISAEADEQTLTQRVADAIGVAVRKMPAAWLWMA